MIDHWGSGPVASADELDQLVYLSHLVGQAPRLVHPGGGNSCIRIGETLLVKGSGTDMRTIHRAGFTQLSLPGLAKLRAVGAMGDPEVMQFMARCMIAEGPAPSLEPPLRALLPPRVIVHTHDATKISLTDVSRETGERLVTELFRDEMVY